MRTSLHNQHLKLIRRNIQDASCLDRSVKSHQERNVFRRRRTKRTRPQCIGSTLGNKRTLLSIALQPNRLFINLASPLSQLQDSFTPPYKINYHGYLCRLRAPCFPRRNPRIPTAVNEQRYLNDSMINCEALMTQFYRRGVVKYLLKMFHIYFLIFQKLARYLTFGSKK
jgi:hypothetical protein